MSHAPDTLRRLVVRAEQDGLDLASLMVLLQAKSLPERALIPAFLYFFLMLYPPKWIADEELSTAGAAGGCILIRRKALERIGGLSAIRSEVIDDCALAKAVKAERRKSMDGTNAEEHKFASLWDFRRNSGSDCADGVHPAALFDPNPDGDADGNVLDVCRAGDSPFCT